MKKEIIGLYVHIPFCPYKCNYCDFLTYSNVDFMIDDYIDSLIKEIEIYGRENHRVDSIFIGGGTPSYIEERHIKRIMEAIWENFEVLEGSEISIEMNPDTLTDSKVKAYLSSGINRFSLGVQTFDEEILKILGRHHSYKIVQKDIDLLRRNGAKNISIDMMMANPKQDMGILRKDLEKILSLDIEHISYYSLILEEKTMFDHWLSSGKISLFDDDLERQMYHEAVFFLSINGFDRYEISNFSKKGHQSVHNKKYWELKPYLGLGLGSSSNLGSKRFSNHRKLKDYHKDLAQDIKPIAYEEDLSLEEREKEYIIMNMRKTEGFVIKDLEERFKLDFYVKYGEVLDKHLAYGTIKLEAGRLSFTDYGIDVSNTFFVDII